LQNHGTYSKDEITLLLKWKLGKTTGKKMDLVKRYVEAKEPDRNLSDENTFTSKDGKRLTELQNELIPLKDTALGVAAKQNAKAVAAHLDKLDETDKDELLAALQANNNSRRGQLKDERNYGEL
jgi:hypothetical protein